MPEAAAPIAVPLASSPPAEDMENHQDDPLSRNMFPAPPRAEPERPEPNFKVAPRRSSSSDKGPDTLNPAYLQFGGNMLSSLVGADVSGVFGQVGAGGNIDPNQMLETIKNIQPKDTNSSPQANQPEAADDQPSFGAEEGDSAGGEDSVSDGSGGEGGDEDNFVE